VEIQSLADKFPAQGNREFSNVLQGRFFDKQGNYRSTARGDKPAGDVSFRGQTGHHDEVKECRLMTQQRHRP
jgi:hypothetical protein